MTENGEKIPIVKCKYLRIHRHLNNHDNDLVCVMGHTPGPQKCTTRFSCKYGKYLKNIPDPPGDFE